MPESSWYVIPGVNPIPWTSPSVAIGRGKGGKPYPIVHSAAELKNYKEAIAETVRERYPDAPLIEDEVALTFFFYRQLPVLEKGTRRKSRSHVADATNMQKSTEDALQGVLFANDRQVVHAESWIMSQTDDTEPLVIVNVVWHPSRPELPDAVLAEVGDHPRLSDDGDDPNAHDVPVEDWF